MKKLLLICFTIGIVSQIFAQGVSITSDGSNPDPSAMLEVQSPPTGLQQGILFPRVDLNSPFVTPIATHLFGVNTNTSYGSGVNSGVGLYRYTGSQWNRLLEAPDADNFWNTKGNAGTDPGTNFIGTTDNKNFVIRVGSGTMAQKRKITVPAAGLGDITVENVRALQLPAGSFSISLLRFSISSGYGLSSPRDGSIAITYGSSSSNSKFFFDLKGLMVTFNNAYPNEPQEDTQLDVEGNIYTRSRYVYSESHTNPSGQTAQPRTAKVERYWSGKLSDGESGTFFEEPTKNSLHMPLRFQLSKSATGYTVQASSKYNGGLLIYVSDDIGMIILPDGGSVWGAWENITNTFTNTSRSHVFLATTYRAGSQDTRAMYRITVMFNGPTDEFVRVLIEAWYNHVTL